MRPASLCAAQTPIRVDVNQDVPLTLGLLADFSGSQEHFIKQHHRDPEAL